MEFRPRDNLEASFPEMRPRLYRAQAERQSRDGLAREALDRAVGDTGRGFGHQEVGKMKQELKIPAVGESVSQAQIAFWLRKEGELVSKGEELFELESEKASMTVPSPFEGTLAILVPAGTEVAIGQVVATIDSDGAGQAAAKAEIATSGPAPTAAGAAAKPAAAPARTTGDRAALQRPSPQWPPPRQPKRQPPPERQPPA